MFPHPFGFDHSPVDHDLHRILEERRPLRRSAPEALRLSTSTEPFTRFDVPPLLPGPSATLYDLARDPRFARSARPAPRRTLRGRLGQALIWLGLALVRPGRT